MTSLLREYGRVHVANFNFHPAWMLVWVQYDVFGRRQLPRAPLRQCLDGKVGSQPVPESPPTGQRDQSSAKKDLWLDPAADAPWPLFLHRATAALASTPFALLSRPLDPLAGLVCRVASGPIALSFLQWRAHCSCCCDAATPDF